MRTSWMKVWVLACVAVGGGSAWDPAGATTLTVPTEAPTIQGALDAGADTVMIRPGVYQETPVILRPVLMFGLSETPEDRPTLAGLAIRVVNHDGPVQDLEFRGLAIVAQVTIVSDYGSYDIIFVECELRDGAVDQSQFGDTFGMTLSRCLLAGSTALYVRQATIDTCHVTGHLNVTGPETGVTVRGCTFEGDGTGQALAVGAAGASVVGNTVRNYERGISVSCESHTVIHNNLVEDCGNSIYAAWHQSYVTNNVVRRCQNGIDVEGGSRIWDNVVSQITYAGISADASYDIRGNVVWGCGGDGIGFYGPGIIAYNTSALNGRSGFKGWNYDALDGVLFTRNIGYENALYGVNWFDLRISISESCNNWYGNEAGGVYGRPPSSADLALDPQFCDGAGGDFRLNSGSELVDVPGCGRIGALGVGCGETPTLVLRFTAHRLMDGVRIAWRVAEGASASEVWLERSEMGPKGGWVRPVTEQSLEGGTVFELDRSAVRDRAYWYRLVALEGHETVVIGQPVEVAAEALLEFRIAEVGPNPGSGPVRIGFRLQDAAKIEIEVFDIRGRRVASVGRGAWPAGAHEVEWDGLTHGGELAPAGLYVLRYAYPGGEDRRRLVRLP